MDFGIQVRTAETDSYIFKIAREIGGTGRWYGEERLSFFIYFLQSLGIPKRILSSWYKEHDCNHRE